MTLGRFARLASPAYMRKLLQLRIYGADARLIDVRIEYCKQHMSTKPHRLDKARLDVCFRNQVVRKGMTRIHFVYVKAWLDGRSELVHDALIPADFVPVEFGSPVTHLRDHDAVAWSFPNDPSLHSLPSVIGSEFAPNHLSTSSLDGKTDTSPSQRAGQRASQRASQRRLAAPSVSRYKPEHHCVTRHEIANDRSRTVDARALYAKTFAESADSEPSARRLYAMLNCLAPRFAAQDVAIQIPEALWIDDNTNTVWLNEVCGVPAASIVRAGDSSRCLSLAAKALACIHHSDVTCTHEITPVDLLHEARKKAAKLRLLLPPGTFMRMIDDVEALVVTQTPVGSNTARCAIHGDFHLDQLLVCRHGLGLLDFDDLCNGDPLQDLAEFIVDLHFRGLAFDRVESLSRCLYRAYRDDVTVDVPVERLQWHVRIQCLEKAWHVLGSYSPGAVATCLRTLELALSDFCRRLA